MILSATLIETCFEAFPAFPLIFFLLVCFLGGGCVSHNGNRQLISTAWSVLKLLLSHSGHHGLVVSYWFSESPITFPHNGCHYLFSLGLPSGFHLSWFLPTCCRCPPWSCSSFNSSGCHGFCCPFKYFFRYWQDLFYLALCLNSSVCKWNVCNSKHNAPSPDFILSHLGT